MTRNTAHNCVWVLALTAAVVVGYVLSCVLSTPALAVGIMAAAAMVLTAYFGHSIADNYFDERDDGPRSRQTENP